MRRMKRMEERMMRKSDFAGLLVGALNRDGKKGYQKEVFVKNEYLQACYDLYS
jgi:hypothetical protein